jgi:hypothetical protein
LPPGRPKKGFDRRRWENNSMYTNKYGRREGWPKTG